MPTEDSNRLQAVIDRELQNLLAITEVEASAKQAEEWSRKEELGHLLDSAANNHVRFVRASLESGFTGPTYDGNGWVRVHNYNHLSWTALVDFWRQYNWLLGHLVAGIPAAQLSTNCAVGSNASVTLGFLIEDYILHMQHHLDHILRRPALTEYPGAAVGV